MSSSTGYSSTPTTAPEAEEASNLNAPLLALRQGTPDQSASLATLLGRATGQGGSSILVRETAARELQQRRADWGYSRPVVALDMMWNATFVVISVVMLACTVDERPNTPIRIWICGYSAQCLVHIVLVWLEYRRRNGPRTRDEERQQDQAYADEGDVEEVGGGSNRFLGSTARSSAAKCCESVNTVVSFIWWMIGFYWVVAGGETLLHNAPRLYWLAVVFLAFDVFFAIFCIVLACLIGIALCCCLPCIIAILYAVAGQEGASEADLGILAKYKYQLTTDGDKQAVGAGKMIPVETSSGYLADERVILPEDAVCCICLSSYEDGVELRALPCNHHFHGTCIVKWLRMNAICPLCKFNILKGNEQI